MKAWLAGALTVTLASSAAHAHEPKASPLDATLRGSDGAQTPLSEAERRTFFASLSQLIGVDLAAAEPQP